MDKENQLYLGTDYVTLEGQFVKHPGNVKTIGQLRAKKTQEHPKAFIGLDLETEPDTGELKLLGFWNEGEYTPFYSSFVSALFSIVRHAFYHSKSIVWWTKLDPFVIYKQFLFRMNAKDRQTSLENWGKIAGDYDKETGEWRTPPVARVHVGQHEFGILQSIRGSIQFYFIHGDDPDYIRKVWAYDIAPIFKSNLRKEGARFDYYEKGVKEVHVVDWKRFETDQEYRKRVLTSNMHDAHVVADLADFLQTNFYKLTGVYPRSLISTGSIARALISTTGEMEDLKSIAIMSHTEIIAKQIGEKGLKDFLCLMNEAYSGGDIETFGYGYAPTAYYSDIASAYPAEGVRLLDLRGATYMRGKGKPPRVKNGYCLIRGDVNMPDDVYHHPITVKHPTIVDMNIRPNGEFRASYFLEERDYCESLGATFSNEEWVLVETKGKLSPLALAIQNAVDERTELKVKDDPAEYVAKIEANSGYGLTYEATPAHERMDGVVKRVGYRTGEFYNPIYAGIMTAKTRIKIAKAVNAIKAKGGQPVLAMTDSVFWTGSPDMIPSDLVREKKTLGYYEGVDTIKNLYCLGAGRYSFDKKEHYQAKTRGLRIQDLIDDNGVVLGFDWQKAIDQADDIGRMRVNVNVLVSVGLVAHQEQYNVEDLGLVTSENREVDLLVGKSKRELPDIEPRMLNESMFNTDPLIIPYFDLSHNRMREKVMRKHWESEDVKEKKRSKRTSKRYYKKNRKNINARTREQYHFAIERGVPPQLARKLAQRGRKGFETGIMNYLNQQ